MADNLGEQGESVSQKRSWGACLAPNDADSHSPFSEGPELSTQISKRSRSEQDFIKNRSRFCDTGRKPSSSSELTAAESAETTLTLSTLDSTCVDRSDSVSFSIGGNGDEGDLQETDSHSPPQNGQEEHEEEEEFDDNVSEMSGMSNLSLEGSGWRPMSGPISWVHHQMAQGADPRQLLKHLLPNQTFIPEDIDQLMLWKLLINIVSEPPKRKKLKDFNTLDDAIDLIKQCKKIIVLTGAGVSVSCGIPDFRSRDGIYARLAEEYPDLPDPQAMFDIHYFRNNPRPFFKFAKEIYPGQFEPSKSHKFIELIESHNKLLRNYTQNIDTLEQVAGIRNVIQCHGSFATATCMVCKYKTNAETVREDIMNQVIPKCPRCPADNPLAIIKPDIVFFGESLSNEFHDQMEEDKDVCDLLIVIGSSLKVRPVALIPNSLPAHVPQLLINREPLGHLNFDIELLGDCDNIVQELCHRLGDSWKGLCNTTSPSEQVTRDDLSTPSVSSQQSPPHHPTPPNSEESTRMSFLQTSDDNSHMSVTDNTVQQSTDGKSPETPARGTAHFRHVMPQEDSRMSFEDGESKRDGSTECNTQGSTASSSNVSQTTASSPGNKNVSAELSSQGSTCTKTDPSLPSDSMGTSLSPPRNELDKLRACWKSKTFNLASKLTDNTFLFLPPSRFVFKGAEVYDDRQFSESEEDSRTSSSDDSDDTSGSKHISPEETEQTTSPKDGGDSTETHEQNKQMLEEEC